MTRSGWLSFLFLFFIQGIFSSLGESAEPSRTLSIVSARENGSRVAIVIGNSTYPSGALANPKNDATAMAASLKKLDFDVELKLDATKADIDGILRRFSGKVEKAAVAAMFYAGHGIQVGGSNYLVPIDANPRSEKDLKRDMVRMDDVIDDMGDARVKLVFFDACRDNPLSRSFSRGGLRGMAPPVESTGTLISFATKHGNTAADGDGTHSPYTNALLAALENPSGVEIEQLLRRVQQGVKRETNGQQEPWRYGSLDGDFYFRAADPDGNSKAQQDVVEKAIQEATRKANEQAARVREEMQKTLKTQQEASDRAIADALKKANEQAVRERTEMQLAMEKILKETLAGQNAALESERAARLAATGGQTPVAQASSVPVVVLAHAPATEKQIHLVSIATTLPRPETSQQAAGQVPNLISEKPVQLASIAPTTSIVTGGGVKPSVQSLEALSNAPGDEWEYIANDEMFGKKQKLVLRVKAVAAEGVLETIVWNDKPVIDWVFGPHATAIGTPNESEFMFSPHWNGSELPELRIEGGSSGCARPGVSCKLDLKILGNEKLTIAAGTFDAIRLEGWVTRSNMRGSAAGPVTIWYSIDQRRLLKQSATKTSGNTKFKETLELSAIHRAPR